MAYLRLNRNKVELVQSVWSKTAEGNAKARTQILATFSTIQDFELEITSKDRRAALEHLSGSPFNIDKITARAKELFGKIHWISNESGTPVSSEAPVGSRMHTSLVCVPLELPESIKSNPPPKWNSFVEQRQGFRDPVEYAQALIIQTEWKLLYGLEISLISLGAKTLLRLERPPSRGRLLAHVEELIPIVNLGAQIISITYLDRHEDEPISEADVFFTTAWRYSLDFEELQSIINEKLDLKTMGEWFEELVAWLKKSPQFETIRERWNRVERGVLTEKKFFAQIAEDEPPQYGYWTRFVWKKAVDSFGPFRKRR